MIKSSERKIEKIPRRTVVRVLAVPMSLFVAFNRIYVCIWHTEHTRFELTGARHLHTRNTHTHTHNTRKDRVTHSPSRCRTFWGAFNSHVHTHKCMSCIKYGRASLSISLRLSVYDTHTLAPNGGENIARATIRYGNFRMNLFKSILNGQPNVAHAIYSLSL